MAMDPFDPGPGELEFDRATFSGRVRLFPLPEPILFPQVVQPLHFFEERYLALVRETLDGDGLIAMGVLRPGWETDYAGRPPLEPVACLGKVVTHHRLEDGRYNVLLAGVARVRLREEIEPPEAFRRARADLLDEVEPVVSDDSARSTHRQLAEAFRAALPAGPPPEALQQVFSADTPLGLLADLAAHALPLPRESKLAALAEVDTRRRALGLVQAIELWSEGGSDARPPFSEN